MSDLDTDLVAAIARHARTARNLDGATALDAVLHLAETGAFALTGTRVHPAGDLLKSARAMRLDPRTTRAIAVAAYPAPTDPRDQYAQASHVVALLKGMGFDPFTLELEPEPNEFDDALAALR